jgi:hypothetical protein
MEKEEGGREKTEEEAVGVGDIRFKQRKSVKIGNTTGIIHYRAGERKHALTGSEQTGRLGKLRGSIKLRQCCISAGD